ncbi:MAG: DUF4037 domain-containing protein [Lentisphaerae bacterium]|nr:DUF4037 domain-containing protein [Lentisphaerota bacterium]
MKAIDLSRRFFEGHARQAFARECPQLFEQMAIGVFGMGSDTLGLDDELSRDHHWGPRLNILVPAKELAAAPQALAPVVKKFPASFEGFALTFDSVLGMGVSVESLSAFLQRFLGLPRAPANDLEWLSMPAPDMLHVVGGEIFHDPSGAFTAVRQQLSYFPDLVWKRRLAHHSRVYSGYGVYGIHRAIKRNNLPFAVMSLGLTLMKGLELAFLLNRRYYPYKKWLYSMFVKLPSLATELDALVQRIVTTEDWPERIRCFDQMSDIFYGDMERQGLIQPGKKFRGSATSGYRLLERALAEILRTLPPEVAHAYPEDEQKYFELMSVDWFRTVPWPEMEQALNLSPQNPPADKHSRSLNSQAGN